MDCAGNAVSRRSQNTAEDDIPPKPPAHPGFKDHGQSLVSFFFEYEVLAALLLQRGCNWGLADDPPVDRTDAPRGTIGMSPPGSVLSQCWNNRPQNCRNPDDGPSDRSNSSFINTPSRTHRRTVLVALSTVLIETQSDVPSILQEQSTGMPVRSPTSQQVLILAPGAQNRTAVPSFLVHATTDVCIPSGGML